MSQKIECESFCLLLLSILPPPPPVVFQVYDTDRDGAISKSDLHHILHAMVGLHIPPEQVSSSQHMTINSFVSSTAQLHCETHVEGGRQGRGQSDISPGID